MAGGSIVLTHEQMITFIEAAGTFLFVFGDNTCHYSLQLLLFGFLLFTADRKSFRWFRVFANRSGNCDCF